MKAAAVSRTKATASTKATSGRDGRAMGVKAAAPAPRSPARGAGGSQSLDRGGQAMAQMLPLSRPFGGDPVHLQHAPGSDERLMTVPRAIGAPEGDQAAEIGRRLGGEILEVAAPQQAQTAPVRRPYVVQVEQDGDDLALGVGVDEAVLLAAH